VLHLVFKKYRTLLFTIYTFTTRAARLPSVDAFDFFSGILLYRPAGNIVSFVVGFSATCGDAITDVRKMSAYPKTDRSTIIFNGR